MNNKYLNSVHKSGKIWGLILCFTICSYPLICCFIYNVTPNWEALIAGLIAVCPIYWAVGTIEMFTYIPMLGAGGTYLAFVTGNVANIKLPCALDCMEMAGCKSDSEEGEIISTISIAVSSITTILVIVIGVLFIIPLRPILESPTLQASFAQILPALFGALAVVFLSKNIKVAVPPVILMMLVFIFVPGLDSSAVSVLIPISAVLTIIYARILYKKGKL